jgi:formylglycine-generating enzyme required for sulfatase activity
MAGPVFISHSSRDVKIARDICDAIERRGMPCWISGRDVGPGDNFGDAIVEAIERAKVMVLVFSTNANNSEEIKKEIALASQHRVTVIPVRVEDITPSAAFRYELATRQWIDMFVDWDIALKRLIDRIASIQAHAAPEGGAPPPVPIPSPPQPAPKPATPEPAPARAIWLGIAAGVVALVVGGAIFLWMRSVPDGGFAADQSKPAVHAALDVAASQKAPPAPAPIQQAIPADSNPPAAKPAPPSSSVATNVPAAPAPAVQSAAPAPILAPPAPAAPPVQQASLAVGDAPAAKPAPSPAALPVSQPPPVQSSVIAPVVATPAPAASAAQPASLLVSEAPAARTAPTPPSAVAAPTPEPAPLTPSPAVQPSAPAPINVATPTEPPKAEPVAGDRQSAAKPAQATAVADAVAPIAVTTPPAAPPPAPAAAPSQRVAAVAPADPGDGNSQPAAKPAPTPPVAEAAAPIPVAKPIVAASLAPSAPSAANAPRVEAKSPDARSFKDCETCPEMVVAPRGSALIGSPQQETARLPQESAPSEAVIPAPFAVSRFDVTFDEWDACVAEGGCNSWRPGDFNWGRGRQPVIFVSWKDAKAYVDWLARKTGKPYRLLSETEWEYAARGCTTTACPNQPFWFGAITPELANYDARYAYAGSPKGLARRRAIPADEGAPNPFGLVNMVGNVRQWVEDCWSANPGPPPAGGLARLSGDCGERVTRGGSYDDKPQDLRAAARAWETVDTRSQKIGFRVARAMDP